MPEEFPEKNLVVVACTANVCRSPMAAALLRSALDAEGSPLNELEVVSAGVTAFGGDPASENSVRALGKVGIALGEHRSRPLNPELLERARYVLVMTSSHRELIRSRYGDACPVYLFREFIGNGAEVEIPDPYGMDLPAYEATRDAMVEAIPGIIDIIRQDMEARQSGDKP